jgi:ABC-type transporter Mla MlaB component
MSGDPGSGSVIGGPVTREGIPELCDRAASWLEGCDADPVVCDIVALVDPDAVTVEALARLQLTARRLGKRIRFRNACGEVHQLVTMMGLEDVLPLWASPLEPGRESEEREHAPRVEEECDP